MKDANAPDFLWADALATVVYAINRMAGSQSGSVTPFEAFFGEKPDISHMWVWYADIFIHCHSWQWAVSHVMPVTVV